MTPPPRLSRDDALFLDFDGTLAPLADDPEAVRLSGPEAEALVALAGQLDGALAVLSGRALDDLSRRVPEALWRVGGHGLEVAAPGAAAAPRRAAPGALAGPLGEVVAGFPGTRLEAKGPVLAVHYRAAPEARVALGNALDRLVAGVPGYALHGGKLVYEVKPEGADKGRALDRAMQAPPFAGRRPVMVGDDVTDEDGFGMAAALGGHGIKVGRGPTAARYRLSGPAAVWLWLGDPG